MLEKEDITVIDQTRRLILETLYKHFRNNPNAPYLERAIIMNNLGIPDGFFDFNAIYLQKKKLVTLLYSKNSWIRAAIEAEGIDAIEKPEEHKEVPFINVQVYGPNYGDIINAVNDSKIFFEKHTGETFSKAYELIETKDLSDRVKAEIIAQTKQLESELKRPEMDISKIQTLWKRIQKEASWLVPTLAQVMTDAIKIALGIK